MEAKVWVIDRIGQSFVILKDNFLNLFFPLFLYNFISVVVVWTILMTIFFWGLWWVVSWSLDFFTILNSPFVLMSITIWTILFISYLLLYIPIFLGLIKSIKQAYEWDNITVYDNIIYWFSRIIKSFNTYWYMFVYVALIPALIFIIWWIIFIIWYHFDNSKFFIWIWSFIMSIWSILFILFALFRWIKASFSLYSAVNNDNFKKENFLNSVSITDDNWWRILWNFFLVWLIISLISWLFSWIFSAVSYSWIDFESIKSIEDIAEIAKNFTPTTQILSWFINNIIKTIGAVFVIIFTYIFFIRLENESNIKNWSWKTELVEDFKKSMEL